MRNRIVPIIVLTGLIVCLGGCAKKPAEPTAAAPTAAAAAETTAATALTAGETTAAGEGAENETLAGGSGEGAFTMKNGVIQMDDLLSAKDWIGKSREEIGLMLDEKEQFFDLEGSFLGKKAAGTVCFEKAKDGKASTVKWVNLIVKKCALYDLYDPLMEEFDCPVDEGLLPYAEANHGSVEWYIFDAGESIIYIGQGSKADFVEVQIKPNPDPQEKKELVLRKRAESEIATLPLIMMMKVVGYENSILTVAITNQIGADMTYTDDYILAKSSDNGTTFAHMRPKGKQSVANEEPNTYEISDLETQELACDLRKFGRVEAGKYMLILDDMQAEFELIPAEEDTGEVASAPWFCPECGKKNVDTDTCESCGAKKE